uniref:Uncharacterized protein n=1 Tax=Chromera velia CCMP2878 TaxID=1169474 RepID=A0A0G4FID0_9ALVE|eukprot:Cvel_17132.t1-p1 / transcript=Cvel_17132.t1 / gene=Cvel_17132 / organism=Chromera_velia_CCMP2878 / gene_product=hypothetical protein / transcript_product=hypothetical protein / location=Cvel_scaffold1352:3719-11691(-) / protein_length=589 / sequence_SO=supercontig / SO=protein_coding / is_pseudo=false
MEGGACGSAGAPASAPQATRGAGNGGRRGKRKYHPQRQDRRANNQRKDEKNEPTTETPKEKGEHDEKKEKHEVALRERAFAKALDPDPQLLRKFLNQKDFGRVWLTLHLSRRGLFPSRPLLELNLSSLGPYDVTAAEMIDSLPFCLQTLKLSRNPRWLFSWKVLTKVFRLKRLPHLRSLDVYDCGLNEGTAEWFPYLENCRELRDLKLSRNGRDLKPYNWRQLARSLSKLTELRSLLIDVCKLGWCETTLFRSLPRNLQTLSISGNLNLGDAPSCWEALSVFVRPVPPPPEAAAASSASVSRLRVLDLGGCGLKGQDAEHLLKCLPGSLTKLSLSYNDQIDMSGWKGLASFMEKNEKGGEGLKELLLAYCGLSSEAAGVVFAALPGCLRKLEVRGNKRIDVKGWTALGAKLQSHTSIYELDVSDCAIDGQKAAAFVPHLPLSLTVIRSRFNDGMSDSHFDSLHKRPRMYMDNWRLTFLQKTSAETLEEIGGLVELTGGHNSAKKEKKKRRAMRKKAEQQRRKEARAAAKENDAASSSSAAAAAASGGGSLNLSGVSTAAPPTGFYPLGVSWASSASVGLPAAAAAAAWL